MNRRSCGAVHGVRRVVRADRRVPVASRAGWRACAGCGAAAGSGPERTMRRLRPRSARPRRVLARRVAGRWPRAPERPRTRPGPVRSRARRRPAPRLQPMARRGPAPRWQPGPWPRAPGGAGVTDAWARGDGGSAAWTGRGSPGAPGRGPGGWARRDGAADRGAGSPVGGSGLGGPDGDGAEGAARVDGGHQVSNDGGPLGTDRRSMIPHAR